MEKQLTLYGTKVYRIEVSDYGLENGYLDYQTLSRMVGDCVLNNYIFEYAGYETRILKDLTDEMKDVCMIF